MSAVWAVVIAAFLQAAPAPIETVARVADSGIDTARQAVVRSAGEWAALWREHAGANRNICSCRLRGSDDDQFTLW